MTIIFGLAFLGFVNLMTFLYFGIDKARAVAGERRIREHDLLVLALIGGSPAAFVARRTFRHKTRKQPFSNQLNGIAVLQVGMIGGLAGAFLLP